MKKKAALMLFTLILTASSLLLVESALASMPKPAVPEFTIKFIDASYEVTTTDPYTGAKVTQPVINRSIEVTIKNQPFLSYFDGSVDSNISLYYNVRMKGQYEENWTKLYSDKHIPTMSNSQYTVFLYPATQYSNAPESYHLGIWETQLPVDAKVDFQVQAMIGYVQHTVLSDAVSAERGNFTFIGEESSWSTTQTLSILPYAFNPTPNGETASDGETQQIELASFALGVAVTTIVVAVAAGLLLLTRRKRHKEAQQT